MRYVFFAVLLLSLTRVDAQIETVDSLNNVLKKKSDLNQEQLFEVFDQLLVNVKKLPEEQSIQKALESAEAAKQNGSNQAVVLAYHNLSKLYADSHKFELGLEVLHQSLDYASKGKENYALGLAHFYLGEFLYSQKLYKSALENVLKAIPFFKGLSKERDLANCYALAASIHYEAGNYQQCIEEAQQAIQYFHQLPQAQRTPESDFEIMSLYNTSGLSYSALNQWDKAALSYDFAEQMANQIGNEFWIGLISGNRSIVYTALGRHEEAIKNLEMDLRMSLKYKEWGSAGLSALSLSDYFVDKNQIDSAGVYLDSARVLLDKARGSRVIPKYWQTKAKVSAAQKRFLDAYQALQRHNSTKDSLTGLQRSQDLIKVKSSHDLSVKQIEIESLARNNELSNERIRTQNIVIGGGILVFILLGILIRTLIQSNKKQKAAHQLISEQYREIEEKNEELEMQGHKLQETNQLVASMNIQLEDKIQERTSELQNTLQELDTFLYRSSHDMRRPLSTLLGLENLAKIELKEKPAIKLFEMVGDTIRHMDNMLQKMQMAHELNKFEMKWESVDINNLLSDIVEKFRKLEPHHSFALETQTGPSHTIVSNSKLLVIIFRNLLENAVSFCKKDSEKNVHVQMYDYPESIQVMITDNGIGIDNSVLNKIFDQYFKGTDQSTGNGLGLYLVRKAVEELGGSVSVKSQLGIGSTFTVILPKKNGV